MIMWSVGEKVDNDTFVKAISKTIGKQWKELARALKFSQTDIDAIAHDHVRNLKEQIHQLFYQWERQNGKDATPQVLLDGLLGAGLEAVLENLQKEGIIAKSSGCGLPVQETPVTPEKPRLILGADSGGPIQETPIAPERPKLIGMRDDDADDLYVDKGSKRSASKLATATMSPESEERHKLRIKRLASLLSKETGEGPFDVGSMVKVELLGYGVVQWLGELKINKDLFAGIEFDSSVSGGGKGDIEGCQYFSCDSGRGLFFPYRKLKRDERFSTDLNSPSIKTVTSELNMSQDTPKDSFKDPPRLSKDCPLLSEESPDTSNSLELMERILAALSTNDISKSLTLKVPIDRAGLVIGREGKNIAEVERATNTSIHVQTGKMAEVNIIGSEEKCKEAAIMILRKLERRVYSHTAASDTIKVPNGMVRRIIGKDGVTVNTIKSLSGVRDIQFSERPSPLEVVLDLDRTCTITGSREEIEEAKKLIQEVIDGADIVTNALFAAVLAKLAESIGVLS